MKTLQPLPPPTEMYRALLERDTSYEGIFIVGVKTTGIFCRPTCPARKPKRENVTFFPDIDSARQAGFRPCKRCQPLDALDQPPEWIQSLLSAVEEDPQRRWSDHELQAMELEPRRVRRWFQAHHGMTFHAFLRTRRLARAHQGIQRGEPITTAAFESGYESLSGFRDSLKKWLGDVPRRTTSRHPIHINRVLTPLGPMMVAANDQGIYMVEFVDRKMLATQIKRVSKRFDEAIVIGVHPLIDTVSQQLQEYYAGTRKRFDLPLRFEGTPFQMSVWQALIDIPYGTTCSYEQLAVRINRDQAQRAVGRANGDNRFAIIIPCHRVIRSDGNLCGYGGGLRRKRWLLEHEKRALEAEPKVSSRVY